MLKFRLAALAILVAGFGLVSVSPVSAQYAPCSIDFDVDPDTLDEDGGDVDGEAESDVPGEWSASNDFDGQTANGSGDDFDFTFSFDDLDDDDEITITVLLVRDDQVTCTASETITVGEEDDDDDDGDDDDKSGGLPDTGGSNAGVIGAGITLLLLGSGVVYLSRRRNEETA